MYPTAIGTMHMRSRVVPPPEVRCFSEYLRAAGYYCTNNAFTDYNFDTPTTAWDECDEQAHWRNRPDPHEVNDLADDPAYADDLHRLRKALADWQRTYDDLGLVPEEELIERWRPGGVTPTTEPPKVEIVENQIRATCPTPGASIAWTIDPPPDPPAPALNPHDIAALLLAGSTGLPSGMRAPELPTPQATPKRRRWRLYAGRFAPPSDTRLWFRACRIGYCNSEDVAIEPSQCRR
jgi:hypothetical protein